MTTRPNLDAPIGGTAPHDLRATLNFAERGLSDSIAAHWTPCKYVNSVHVMERRVEQTLYLSLSCHRFASKIDVTICQGGRATKRTQNPILA